MGIVNGNPMGMGISMVGEWEREWEWEWLYGNGREWESERHSRTPLVQATSPPLSIRLSSLPSSGLSRGSRQTGRARTPAAKHFDAIYV